MYEGTNLLPVYIQRLLQGPSIDFKMKGWILIICLLCDPNLDHAGYELEPNPSLPTLMLCVLPDMAGFIAVQHLHSFPLNHDYPHEVALQLYHVNYSYQPLWASSHKREILLHEPNTWTESSNRPKMCS